MINDLDSRLYDLDRGIISNPNEKKKGDGQPPDGPLSS